MARGNHPSFGSECYYSEISWPPPNYPKPLLLTNWNKELILTSSPFKIPFQQNFDVNNYSSNIDGLQLPLQVTYRADIYLLFFLSCFIKQLTCLVIFFINISNHAASRQNDWVCLLILDAPSSSSYWVEEEGVIQIRWQHTNRTSLVTLENFET